MKHLPDTLRTPPSTNNPTGAPNVWLLASRHDTDVRSFHLFPKGCGKCSAWPIRHRGDVVGRSQRCVEQSEQALFYGGGRRADTARSSGCGSASFLLLCRAEIVCLYSCCGMQSISPDVGIRSVWNVVFKSRCRAVAHSNPVRCTPR